MLQFLPALLLLMLNGASPVDRLALAERLPEALRILIEVKSPDEDETPLPSPEADASSGSDILQLTPAQIEIAKVLAQLFESALAPKVSTVESALDTSDDDLDRSQEWDSPPMSSDRPFLESRRSRAGPAA